MLKSLTLLYILLLAISAISNAQKVTSRQFSRMDGLCSNSIVINSNNTYTQEGGCEGSSRVHFGRWKQVDDTTLRLLPNDIPIIRTITFRVDTTRTDCRTAKFHITDILGEPIYGFDIAFRKPPVVPNNTMNWMIRNPRYDGEQIFETDDSGFLEVNFSSYDTVEFRSLEIYGKGPLRLSVNDLEGKIVSVQMNANKLAFQYPEIEFNTNNEPLLIKLRKKAIAVGDGNNPYILVEDE